MKIKTSTLSFLLAVVLPSHATTIVGIQSSGDYGYYQDLQMAQQFRTGAGSVTLESITLRVTNNYATVYSVAMPESGFWALLYTDNGDQIGSALTTFTIQSDYFQQPASEFDAPTYLVFQPDQSVTLDADTNYWIYLENMNTYSWLYAQMATFEGNGSFGKYYTTNGGYSDWGGTTAFDMTVTGAAAIPEPTTLGLFLAGIAGIAGRRRR